MVKRIKPSQLRENFFEWVKTHPHPYIAPKDIRFLGIKQIYTEHPHFNIFCTNPNSVASSYRRFLINKMQDTYNLSGCPIVLAFKAAGLKKRGKENTGSDLSEKEF
jgi:predicted GTPase